METENGISRVTLEKIQCTVQHVLMEHELGALAANASIDLIEAAGRSAALRIKTSLYALPTERVRIHEKWPADWWQAFKDRWFPRWLLKRYSVQWKEVQVDKQLYGRICPHLAIADQRHHLQFMLWGVEEEPDGCRHEPDMTHVPRPYEGPFH